MRSFALIAFLAVAMPDRPNPTPREAQSPSVQIIDDWRYLGNGKITELRPGASDFTLRILPGESIWIEYGRTSVGNSFTANVTIDWEKEPTTMDFAPKAGGSAVRAIMQLDADRLTIGWSGAGNVRPKNFAAAQHVCHFARVRR